MPHVGGGSGDDLASSDEIKVFKDEGEDEQKESDENLTEDKSSLVTEGETEKALIPCQSYSSSKNAHGVSRSDTSPGPGKSFEPPHSIGYMVSPYSHANGTLGSMASKVASAVAAGMVGHPGSGGGGAGGSGPHHPSSPLPFVMYSGDAFAQPPPAHMGIPPVHFDPKTGIPLVAFQSFSWKDVLEQQGIPRPPMYPLAPPGQYPHHLFSPEFPPQLQWPLFSRHPPSMYPMGGSPGFRGPYPAGLSAAAAAAAVSAAGLPRFPPPGLLPPHLPHPHHPHHPHLHSHPGMPSSPSSASASAIITPGPKQELLPHLQDNCRHPSSYSIDQKPLLKLHAIGSPISNHQNNTNNNNNNNNSSQHGVGPPNGQHHSGGRPPSSGNHASLKNSEKKQNHIKKPLNAFMLYMKEMRAKVVAECTLKESAAINQILGRRWHSLSREEQAKYYEMARKERQLHMQLYPGWSARDNYALNAKKKKRKRDKSQDADGNNPKKCRARYGLDQQSNWCKPCRRKKKCVRYMDGMTESGGDDNLGSVESMEAPTPDSAKSSSDQDSDPLNTSSELSLSSPACSLPSVPSDLLDQKPPSGLMMDNGLLPHHHPLSIHHLSQSVVLSSSSHPDSSEADLPQLPTPPSTDSSTTTTAPTLLTVT